MIKMSIPNELIEEIRGILEKAIGSLKNVEKFLNQRSEEAQIINNNLDNFENIINENIETINTEIVPKIQRNFDNKFEEITGKTKKLSYVLNTFKDVVVNLQEESKQVSEFDINKLLYEVVELEEIDFSQPIRVTPIETSTGGSATVAGGGSITEQISAMGKTSQVSSEKVSSLSPADIQSAEIIDPNKWTDSEIEGFQVFDEIITGWKLRDFEALKGTREIFAIAWRKLSSHDRKKIRNGAWSEPIIKKITLLGRSRLDED
ncbi:MAG: hypothetical protein EAX96_03565 [Candidatus Lokiarchaeota archaeon]|nr:hypothetical protein [Candidatus Lokiarchaeota archaeon]